MADEDSPNPLVPYGKPEPPKPESPYKPIDLPDSKPKPDKSEEPTDEDSNKDSSKIQPIVDTYIHYAKKGGHSTLCGMQIPPAKESMMEEEITCPVCKGKLKWLGIPNRPSP